MGSPRPARPLVVPSKTNPTGVGWGFCFFMKGDGQKTHNRAVKKAMCYFLRFFLKTSNSHPMRERGAIVLCYFQFIVTISPREPQKPL